MLRDFQHRLELNATRQRQAVLKRMLREYQKALAPRPRPTEAELDAYYAGAAFRPVEPPAEPVWWPGPDNDPVALAQSALARNGLVIARLLAGPTKNGTAPTAADELSTDPPGHILSRFAAQA